jgi:hypothetical protein
MVEKVSVLTADGREAELRIRSRRRVAARAGQLPTPPPPKMFLMCNGAKVELRLTWDKPIHGFYVYYVGLRRLGRRLKKRLQSPLRLTNNQKPRPSGRGWGESLSVSMASCLGRVSAGPGPLKAGRGCLRAVLVGIPAF